MSSSSCQEFEFQDLKSTCSILFRPMTEQQFSCSLPNHPAASLVYSTTARNLRLTRALPCTAQALGLSLKRGQNGRAFGTRQRSVGKRGRQPACLQGRSRQTQLSRTAGHGLGWNPGYNFDRSSPKGDSASQLTNTGDISVTICSFLFFSSSGHAACLHAVSTACLPASHLSMDIPCLLLLIASEASH